MPKNKKAEITAPAIPTGEPTASTLPGFKIAVNQALSDAKDKGYVPMFTKIVLLISEFNLHFTLIIPWKKKAGAPLSTFDYSADIERYSNNDLFQQTTWGDAEVVDGVVTYFGVISK